MRKLLIIIFCIGLFSGCGEVKESKEKNTNLIFKNELSMVSSIGEAKNKVLEEEIIEEDVKAFLDNIFSSTIFESSDIKLGGVVEGTGPDGKGGRIFCCKLPAEVSFIGTEESIKKFVKYFSELENVVSFGNFNIETLEEDEKYKVEAIINFFAKTKSETVGESKNTGYTIKMNQVEFKEEEEIVLRDFDISMVVRPSNSDASAISLGVESDKDYRIFDNDNSKKDIVVEFSNDGGKYYSKYSIDGEDETTTSLKPNGNILFDIISCDIIEKDDDIKVDLHVINNSNKKVSLAIYGDKDKRVNIVEKVGSIEVKK